VKVSVIIPNYNHGCFLKQRIESILNQSFRDFEVIIIDDCSTDDSKEIIESYRHNLKIKKIVYNKKNTGSPFPQWRKGIDLAQGEYVWIAESDDWANPDFLAVLINRLSFEANVGICFCGSNWIDQDGNIGEDLSLYNENFFRNGKEEIRYHMINYNSVQNVSSALIKRELAKKFIKKTISYKSAGDWSLYIDVLAESNILYVKEKLNNFRWYHNNISNDAKKKGLWITEGLKIIARSNAYKISFNNSEFKNILYCWNQKCKEFESFTFKRLKFQVLTYYYFLIFSIRRILFLKGII